MQQLRASFQVHQRRHRLPVATRARQQRHRNGIHPAVAAKGQQSIDRAAFESSVEPIARLEGKTAGGVSVAGAGAYPTLVADHNGNRLVKHLDIEYRFFLGLYQGPARVSKLFRIQLDFLDH